MKKENIADKVFNIMYKSMDHGLFSFLYIGGPVLHNIFIDVIGVAASKHKIKLYGQE